MALHQYIAVCQISDQRWRHHVATYENRISRTGSHRSRETVSVCGKVYSAKFTGSITHINMVGDYPNNPFTAVIMVKNRGNFTYKPEEYLTGKTICVTGTVQNYKGKPEIVVEKDDRIIVR